MLKTLLPDDCQLRPATAADMDSIRRLVWSARLDPTQLRWSQFWVIEQTHKIIACGQLRTFPMTQELGSLVVISKNRGRGLGTCLAKHLIEIASQPLYLECLGDELCQFYGQLGFTSVEWAALPRPLQFKFGVSQIAKIVLRLPVRFMQYQQLPQ